MTVLTYFDIIYTHQRISFDNFNIRKGKIMKKFLSVFAVILAMVTVLASFAACAGDVETTDAPITEAPATEAPETEVPETEAPATEAPETEAPETEAPAVEVELPTGLVVENGVFKSLTLDFETNLQIPEYLASFPGFAANKELRGGEIKDGKWNYANGKCFAIEDTYGIYNLDKFSVEFDINFSAFTTPEGGASLFTMLGDDDGALSDKSSFFICFRMLPNGEVYHANVKDTTRQLELNKTYNYKIVADRTTGKVNVYIDNELLVTTAFKTSDNLPYHCFRFIDLGKGGSMWIDNIVIKNLCD